MLVATVLDLDETLADSGSTWQRVFGVVAAHHGHTWTNADWKAIQGRDTGYWGAYLAGRCQGLTPRRAVSECVTAMVTAIENGDFGLLPGAADLIATAASRGPVGLVSASPRRYVEAAATRFGLAEHLTTMVTGDDVVRGKPAPDPYLLAAKNLGVSPRVCLAVEDSASGIHSAYAAGMTVMAIPNPTTSPAAVAMAAHHTTDAHLAAELLPTLVGARSVTAASAAST